jgi:hypothetical protein
MERNFWLRGSRLLAAGVIGLALLISGGAIADEVEAAEPQDLEVEELGDLPIEDLLSVDITSLDLTLEDMLDIDVDGADARSLIFYGFVRANMERVFHIPSLNGAGETTFSNDPMEWDFPGVHLYGFARPVSFVDTLINIEGNHEGVIFREGWGNVRIDKALQARAGKMYRRFGLFNEKLDQFPTFLGIEPPELFDKDHLLLTRTTNFAVHGSREFGDYTASYFLTTGNGEAGAEKDVYPLGWDLRVKGKSFQVGTSGFLSSMGGGGTSSTTGVGDGSPRGGVLPWMSEDEYVVFGFFGEYVWKRLLLQAAYWQANHEANRDSFGTMTVGNEAGINPRQASRFFGANAACVTTSSCVEGDVIGPVDYTVRTFYVRAGYTIPTSWGAFTPYVFVDWMNHPEVIANKGYGGDNESGVADDGKFWKPSVGVVYKPHESVAIKLDSSAHIQKFNGKTEVYPEVRLDISFAFKMFDKAFGG